MISELVPALVKPFVGEMDAVNLGQMTDALIDCGQADAVGLVLAELTVNSLKHGALSNGGTINLHAESCDNSSRIIWTEELTEAVIRQSRPGGQGLSLITQIVAARSGTLNVGWTDFGLTAVLEFPLIHA